MSAWVVDRGHIDVLLAGMVAYDIIKIDDAVSTGKMLWRENVRSVNYRYSEKDRTPRYTSHTQAEEPLHPIAVLKATQCYAYQTCEHPEWKQSESYALTQQLTAAILARNPDLAVMVPYINTDRMREIFHESGVYRVAPWGFVSVAQAYESKYAEVSK